MATIQGRMSGGHRYWYIVESRRVNGKPRPIPLLYLGKADDLLKRLTEGFGQNIKCKSYSHGAIAAFIRVIDDLKIIDIINEHVPKKKKNKQMRDGLTVGASLVFRAIERVCYPCSNSEFSNWAKNTSLEYLLRISTFKLDSQHFWDQMSELPVEAIPQIEEKIVKNIVEHEKISLDTLLLDATNFFTFISTTNEKCKLAQRGKPKQGRKNLKQVGLFLVVSRKDIIPLFHETYRGNKADSKMFASTIDKITERISAISPSLEDLTLVFDRGNNSKSNLSQDLLKIHYVGALSPSHHKDLMEEAKKYFSEAKKKREKKKKEESEQPVRYRVKQKLWGETRTLLVYKSEELYRGQIRGIENGIQKKFDQFEELNEKLRNPRCKKLSRKEILEKIESIVSGQFFKDIIDWKLRRSKKVGHYIEYGVDDEAFEELQNNRLGYRVLMTDRHQWTDEEIISAYHSQSKVEYAFRNLKNPYHGSVRPQFHWTDQKITVHVFTCVLGFLLESVVYRRLKQYGCQLPSYDTLFDRLNNIRLATLVEKPARKEKRGRFKVNYQLEEMEPEDETFLDALDIRDIHIKRPKLSGLVVYNS